MEQWVPDRRNIPSRLGNNRIYTTQITKSLRSNFYPTWQIRLATATMTAVDDKYDKYYRCIDFNQTWWNRVARCIHDAHVKICTRVNIQI